MWVGVGELAVLRVWAPVGKSEPCAAWSSKGNSTGPGKRQAKLSPQPPAPTGRTRVAKGAGGVSCECGHLARQHVLLPLPPPLPGGEIARLPAGRGPGGIGEHGIESWDGLGRLPWVAPALGPALPLHPPTTAARRRLCLPVVAVVGQVQLGAHKQHAAVEQEGAAVVAHAAVHDGHYPHHTRCRRCARRGSAPPHTPEGVGRRME